MTARDITLRLITSPSSRGRTSKFRTLESARRHAWKVVGVDPKVDPDGYLVNRRNGHCLFLIGVTVEELYPKE